MVEMNLDESLLRQLGIEPTDNTSVEFDAKGTMHIIDRDAEGALVKDSPITGDARRSSVSDYRDIMDECEEVRRRAALMKSRYRVVTAGIIIVVILAFILMGVLSL